MKNSGLFTDIVVAVSISLGIGAFVGVGVASVVIYNEDGIGFKEQTKVIASEKSTNKIEIDTEMENEIPMGCIGITKSMVSGTNFDIVGGNEEMSVVNIVGTEVKEIAPKGSIEENTRTPLIKEDYTLGDYYHTGDLVDSYTVFYFTVMEKDKEVISYIACNYTEEPIKAEDCEIIAMGVDRVEGYFGYGNISVNTTQEEVHKIMKDKYKNIHSINNYETYMDKQNNFIYIIFEQNKVVSFMVGNTLGESTMYDSITN